MPADPKACRPRPSLSDNSHQIELPEARAIQLVVSFTGNVLVWAVHLALSIAAPNLALNIGLAVSRLAPDSYVSLATL